MMSGDLPDLDHFRRLATQGKALLMPMYRLLMSDSLTPVLAYRRLVRHDERMAPSFLLESVVGGDRVGRYSYLGAQPAAQVVVRGHDVYYMDTDCPDHSQQYSSQDPLHDLAQITTRWNPVQVTGLPDFSGGWVGYAGYDTVRYLEGEKLPHPPADDRHLPDLQMALYRKVAAFDHVRKTIMVITHVVVDDHATVDEAYRAGQHELDELVSCIESPRASDDGHAPSAVELPIGRVELDAPPPALPISNMDQGGYQRCVKKAKEHIAAGDIFQVVPSQRFELRTAADPFDIYRALRVVNPSPYMFYLQIEGGMLVGSSPEILCRVHDGQVVSRPLAGTRRRGRDEAEDRELERQLLADPKERAEHIMLVDLGRNDIGRVAKPASIQLAELMAIERYSHVMHISSTVTGQLDEPYTCWDALRHTLPVGTVSGAPKVRAMQIIDDLEPTRRGPYAGAVGYVDFAGNMDMAIALRTMVITPSAPSADNLWSVHIQAGAGIVADSDPDLEHQETINKAAALAKAVDLAEKAFSMG